jgi:hypothetical protein
MALFGGARDISMFRKVNRELLGDIITQQVAVYKYVLDKTKTNMYGEASGGKFFTLPVLLNALITVADNTSPTNEFGVNFGWSIKVAFLVDDLIDANITPEIGDVFLYQESYFEIDNTVHTQYFAGKDPDYPYSTNPLNPNLDQFGYNVSLVCDAHYIPADRVNIVKQRL